MSKLRNICAALCLCIGLLECGLRFIDPLGATKYYADLSRLLTMLVRTPDGYGMYPAMYTFSDWHALIQTDGTRYTPDAQQMDCSCAFLGDSVTFGQGVSDADTFVNLLASQVDARLINAGVPGYSSRNVLRAYERLNANGYIYLVFWNDADRSFQPLNWQPAPYHGYHATAIEGYIRLFQRAPYPEEWGRFRLDIAALRRPDVLLVAFEDTHGFYRRVQQLVPELTIIPHYTSVISYADPHANREGSIDIADNIKPAVISFIQRVCGSK